MNPLASIIIHSGTNEVYRGDRRVKLTRHEFAIFKILWLACGHSVPHSHIKHSLRPECDIPISFERVLWTMAHRIRVKLSLLGIDIIATHGEGYSVVIIKDCIDKKPISIELEGMNTSLLTP